jgi:hypothetical protein
MYDAELRSKAPCHNSNHLGFQCDRKTVTAENLSVIRMSSTIFASGEGFFGEMSYFHRYLCTPIEASRNQAFLFHSSGSFYLALLIPNMFLLIVLLWYSTLSDVIPAFLLKYLGTTL